MGVGGGTSFAVAINLTQVGLAASSQFRKPIYLPTIMRGYEMTLMDSDRRNRVYLDKCVLRLEDHAE